VAVFDLGSDPRRLRLVMPPADLEKVTFLRGDIRDPEVVLRAVQESQATHIIHLAALQVPFCKANPILGAQVNVVGTVNVFEAAKQAGIAQVVYASSVAVYGLSTEYSGVVDSAAPLNPHTFYGVYKQANEGTARLYWEDSRLSSIGLRPYALYGPGRDQGLTSGPTQAMLAAAAGRSYHIPFGGRYQMQYNADVAEIFIRAVRTRFQGAGVFNLRGALTDTPGVIAAIEAAAPQATGTITFTPSPLPIPEEFDDTPLRNLLGELPDTPLVQGVAATIDFFRQAIHENRMTADG
jgi:nucleoside-diphosphate-sugar epimerase